MFKHHPEAVRHLPSRHILGILLHHSTGLMKAGDILWCWQITTDPSPQGGTEYEDGA